VAGMTSLPPCILQLQLSSCSEKGWEGEEGGGEAGEGLPSDKANLRKSVKTHLERLALVPLEAPRLFLAVGPCLINPGDPTALHSVKLRHAALGETDRKKMSSSVVL